MWTACDLWILNHFWNRLVNVQDSIAREIWWKEKTFLPGKWLTCRWKRLLISQIWMPKKIGVRKIIYWSREMCQGSCLDKQDFRPECWLNILSKNKIKPKSAPWMYSRHWIETLSRSVFDLSETWRSMRKFRDIQLNPFSTCTPVKITLLTDDVLNGQIVLNTFDGHFRPYV